MWEKLNSYILEQIFCYLDSYELFVVIPKVCYSWKNNLKLCVLPRALMLGIESTDSSGDRKLTDECLHKILIEFDLSEIVYLDLSYQLSLKDRSILNFSNYCQNLKSVNLMGCSSLNDVSLKYLSSVPNIQSITLGLSELTGSSLHFLSRLPNLEHLHLEKLFRLRQDFLENFMTGYPSLKVLIIRQCKLITHDFFLFLVAETDMPVLEELVLDGLIENKDSVRAVPDLTAEQEALRYLSLRRLGLFNLTWLNDLYLTAFLRNCNLSRLSHFQLIRCNPLMLWAVQMLLSAPNVLGFVIEGNQVISDRDLLDAMFSNRGGLFRNCCNISDQIQRQMARSNPNIKFENRPVLAIAYHPEL